VRGAQREPSVASGRFVRSGVADLVKGAFDEIFTLFADVVIDGGHRLDRAGGGAGEGELAIGDFTLVEDEWAVAQNDKAAVGELAAFVFVEIEDDFFVGEFVFGDFHRMVRVVGIGFVSLMNTRGVYERSCRDFLLLLSFRMATDISVICSVLE